MRALELGVRGVLLPVVVLVLLASGVGPTLAAIPNPADGRYYACVARRTGEVRLIDYPEVSRCRRGQTLTSWGASGPQGPIGPEGPIGPTGKAGPQGPVGFESTQPGRGTAFPTDVTPGTEFFRTDIRDGMSFRYDGRRWLSEQVFLLSMIPVQRATDDLIIYGYPLPTDQDVWIDAVQFTAFGNGVGTWVHSLETALFDESSYPVLASWTFSPGSTHTEGRWYTDRVEVGKMLATTGGDSGSSPRALAHRLDETAGSSSTYGGLTVEYRLIAK